MSNTAALILFCVQITFLFVYAAAVIVFVFELPKEDES